MFFPYTKKRTYFAVSLRALERIRTWPPGSLPEAICIVFQMGLYHLPEGIKYIIYFSFPDMNTGGGGLDYTPPHHSVSSFKGFIGTQDFIQKKKK